MSEDHYLRRELYELVRTDPAIFEWLQEGSLDGIWYWDLESPAHEWMSGRFWRVFGYDPADKAHLASEWQDMIHPDDLAVALDNFNLHCKDPSHAYDQLVRYTHRDGSTVWVRCRGLAIRDEDGTPKRMLGAHNELTSLKVAEERLAARLAVVEQLNAELAAFNELVVDREHRMIQLKVEVNALHERLGEPPRYDLTGLLEDEAPADD